MAYSFQEKSLWLMLVSLLTAFGLYFVAVLPNHATVILPQEVGLFVVAVVMVVIMQIVGHAVIAIIDRRPQTDERDRQVMLRGSRYGSIVLAIGVFGALCAAVLTEGNFIFAHLLLGFWVLAQVVEIASQLYLYRYGIVR
jgi:hypothetical protein